MSRGRTLVQQFILLIILNVECVQLTPRLSENILCFQKIIILISKSLKSGDLKMIKTEIDIKN